MYWKTLYLFALCFLTLGLLAQQKGVTPLDAGKEPKPTRTIHAVIVGVSEYADEVIPDLKYADEDALAFHILT
jgi:hypothetical protein